MKPDQKHLCIDGGKPPCPICLVQPECPHGRSVVGKSRKTTRALEISMSPSEAGRDLSCLAVAKRRRKE